MSQFEDDGKALEIERVCDGIMFYLREKDRRVAKEKEYLEYMNERLNKINKIMKNVNIFTYIPKKLYSMYLLNQVSKKKKELANL